MSSRVQKGGTVFRPIAKAKSRPASSTPVPSETRPFATTVQRPATTGTTVSTSNGPSSLAASTPVSNTSLPQTSPLRDLPIPASSEPSAPLSTGKSPTPEEDTGLNSQTDDSPSAPTAISGPTPAVISQPFSTSVASRINTLSRATPISISRPAVLQPTTDSTHSSSVFPVSVTPNDATRSSVQPNQGSVFSFLHEQPRVPTIIATPSQTNPEGNLTTPKVTGQTSDTSDRDQNEHEDSTTQTKPKRKRIKKHNSDPHTHISSGTEPEGEMPSKKKRSASKAGIKRKPRTETAPLFDPDADAGEELDPTQVSMGQLCEDTGVGRVSSRAAQVVENYSTWKQSSRERRAQIAAQAEARKYGRNEDQEGIPTSKAETQQNADQLESAGPSHSAGWTTIEGGSPAAEDEGVVVDVEVDKDGGEDGDKDGFDYSQAMQTSRYNVQVRIGPNGETIIDEQSLFVDRNDNGEDETAGYTHVEESDMSKFVNSMSYTKKLRGSRWSAEETELFYNALSQFGENYELISLVLPGRDRRACKNKFKAEDKRSPNRINWCLSHRTPYDIQTLSRLTGKDFSGPTPEIRVPTPPVLALPVDNTDQQQPQQKAKKSHKKNRTPGTSDGEEIVGTADSFVDDFEE